MQSDGDADPVLGNYKARPDLVINVFCLNPVNKLALTVQSICQAPENVFFRPNSRLRREA